jgi:hypothetical protein
VPPDIDGPELKIPGKFLVVSMLRATGPPIVSSHSPGWNCSGIAFFVQPSGYRVSDLVKDGTPVEVKLFQRRIMRHYPVNLMFVVENVVAEGERMQLWEIDPAKVELWEPAKW